MTRTPIPPRVSKLRHRRYTLHLRIGRLTEQLEAAQAELEQVNAELRAIASEEDDKG